MPAAPAHQDELPTNILALACPSRSVLRHLTDRWTPMIVSVLAGGQTRFGDLQKTIEGISPKVLTETLRSLERDGLITRTVTPTVPMRVDYELTVLGTSLIEPITALRNWAQDHADEVIAARESYDSAPLER